MYQMSQRYHSALAAPNAPRCALVHLRYQSAKTPDIKDHIKKPDTKVPGNATDPHILHETIKNQGLALTLAFALVVTLGPRFAFKALINKISARTNIMRLAIHHGP